MGRRRNMHPEVADIRKQLAAYEKGTKMKFKVGDRVCYWPRGWVGRVKSSKEVRWFGKGVTMYTLDMEEGDYVGIPFNASENNLEPLALEGE